MLEFVELKNKRKTIFILHFLLKIFLTFNPDNFIKITYSSNSHPVDYLE
jgi:hypothetical protein